LKGRHRVKERQSWRRRSKSGRGGKPERAEVGHGEVVLLEQPDAPVVVME
jgi:hypothetical protein